MRLAIALASFGLIACGDDAPVMKDGGVDDAPIVDALVDGAVDAPPDAPPDAAATFTSFVIDLVTNHTAGDTDPVPFATFMGLPDPDQNNPAAYDVLFP